MFEYDKRPLVMGILNVTPDSFSDGGSYDSVEVAVDTALQMVADGADIIDVGGESTRPGYTKISDDEEIGRVVPVIEGIRAQSDIPISIDTYKYEVARAGFEAGANILNDIWGLKSDERLAGLVAEMIEKEHNNKSIDNKKEDNNIYNKIGICIMHNRKGQREDERDELLSNVCDELMESIDIAIRAGIPTDRILLDPGIGFGKSYEQNLYLISHIDKLIAAVNRRFGDMKLPFMMAASRKSVIGLTLDVPMEEREEATVAISVYSAMKGCAAVRVHDVAGNVRALKMLSALKDDVFP